MKFIKHTLSEDFEKSGWIFCTINPHDFASDSDLTKKLVLINNFSPFSCDNIWITKMMVNDNSFLEDSKYICPFFGYEFYGILPEAIICNDNDSDKYINNFFAASGKINSFENEHYTKNLFKDANILNKCALFSMDKIRLGHGYVDEKQYLYPSGDLHLVKFRMENGDDMLAWTWKQFRVN